jgi:putative endonuclease
MWYVYIVECLDGSLYTGITTDIERRIHEHNNTKKGAKYTRSRRPVTLLWSKSLATQSEALLFEIQIKKLKRTKKLELISKKDSAKDL